MPLKHSRKLDKYITKLIHMGYEINLKTMTTQINTPHGILIQEIIKTPDGYELKTISHPLTSFAC